MTSSIESAVRLPLDDGEWLTVVGMTDPRDTATVPPKHKPYLTISGADLARIRDQRISGEDARTLVRARFSW